MTNIIETSVSAATRAAGRTFAVRIHAAGGPEAMTWEEIPIEEPGPGELLVRHTAVGVNFVDIQMRRGFTSHFGPLPVVLGRGGAGVVEAVGRGVEEWYIGDRVAYAPYTGSYCQRRLIDAAKVVRTPDWLDDEIAGASILQGLTAQYLIRQVHAVGPRERLLVHAAAGGVGAILCQWAASLGAEVIGTVSSEEKAAVARANGCRHAIVTANEDFVQRVSALTGGRKVDVVYDSVGADTFLRSLDCLRPGGHIVSFGTAAGPVPPLDIETLGRKGALTVTKGTLLAFSEGRGQLRSMSADWFEALRTGAVRVTVNQRYPLRDAARAHEDIEGRRTTGSSVLVV